MSLLTQHAEKLVLAQRHFYAYEFRPAYHLYRIVFSKIPFQQDDTILEHMSFFCRTLFELARLDELKFYLPFLERYYEKSRSPSSAFALAYLKETVGTRTDTSNLFRYVREHADSSVDLRIKATMMLARNAATHFESIRLIHSLTEKPTDPHLEKLLQVWHGMIPRYQGNTEESIRRLKTLVASFQSKEEWYCLLSAKDALIRSYLHAEQYDLARKEISSIGTLSQSLTSERHVQSLNEAYRKRLAERSILRDERDGFTSLSSGNYEVAIRQAPMRRLIHFLQRCPQATIGQITKSIDEPGDRVHELLDSLIEKLEKLQLPADSVHRESMRVHLIPSIHFAKSSRKEIE